MGAFLLSGLTCTIFSKKDVISIPGYKYILGNHPEESVVSYEQICPCRGFSNNQDGHIWLMGIPFPDRVSFLYPLTIFAELHLALV
jgi:hypothetical protein